MMKSMVFFQSGHWANIAVRVLIAVCHGRRSSRRMGFHLLNESVLGDENPRVLEEVIEEVGSHAPQKCDGFDYWLQFSICSRHAIV